MCVTRAYLGVTGVYWSVTTWAYWGVTWAYWDLIKSHPPVTPPAGPKIWEMVILMLVWWNCPEEKHAAMSINTKKSGKWCADDALMMRWWVSYLIYLNPLHFKNVMNVGSLQHFFLCLCEQRVIWAKSNFSLTQGRGLAVYINTFFLELSVSLSLCSHLYLSFSLFSPSPYERRHRPLYLWQYLIYMWGLT